MAATPKSTTSWLSWTDPNEGSRADGARWTGRRLRSVPGPLRPGRRADRAAGGGGGAQGRDGCGAGATRFAPRLGEVGAARADRRGAPRSRLRTGGVLRRIAQGAPPRSAPRLARREGAGGAAQLRRRRGAARDRGRAGAGGHPRRLAAAVRTGASRA